MWSEQHTQCTCIQFFMHNEENIMKKKYNNPNHFQYVTDLILFDIITGTLFYSFIYTPIYNKGGNHFYEIMDCIMKSIPVGSGVRIGARHGTLLLWMATNGHMCVSVCRFLLEYGIH